jgi:hypothetical protein
MMPQATCAAHHLNGGLATIHGSGGGLLELKPGLHAEPGPSPLVWPTVLRQPHVIGSHVITITPDMLAEGPADR